MIREVDGGFEPTPLCFQVRATAQSANQERSLSDHQVQLLREDLASAKTALSEVARKETHVRTRA